MFLPLKPADLTVDVVELSVTVGMLPSLPRLGVRLQAVPEFMQQLGDQVVADLDKGECLGVVATEPAETLKENSSGE